MHNIRLIFSGFLIVLFSVFGQTAFIGAYMDDIRMAYGLSYTHISGYYAAATITAAFTMMTCGKCLDRYNAYYLSVFCLFLTGIGLCVGTLSDAPIILLLCFFMLRLFSGGIMPPLAVTLVNRYVDNAKGKATACVQAGWPTLTFVAPLLVVTAQIFLPWQDAWRVYALCAVTILPLALFLSFGNHRHTRFQPEDSLKTISPLSTDKRFYLMLAAFMMTPVFVTSIMFYQKEIAAAIGVSYTLFVGTFALFAAGSVAGNIISGAIIDRTAPRVMLVAVAVMYIAGFLLLANASGIGTLSIAMCMIGATDGASGSVSGPLIARMYGVQGLGRIKTTLYGVLMAGAAASPVFTGYMLDTGAGVRAVFSVFAAYAACVLLLVVCNFSAFKTRPA